MEIAGTSKTPAYSALKAEGEFAECLITLPTLRFPFTDPIWN